MNLNNNLMSIIVLCLTIICIIAIYGYVFVSMDSAQKNQLMIFCTAIISGLIGYMSSHKVSKNESD